MHWLVLTPHHHPAHPPPTTQHVRSTIHQRAMTCDPQQASVVWLEEAGTRTCRVNHASIFPKTQKYMESFRLSSLIGKGNGRTSSSYFRMTPAPRSPRSPALHAAAGAQSYVFGARVTSDGAKKLGPARAVEGLHVAIKITPSVYNSQNDVLTLKHLAGDNTAQSPTPRLIQTFRVLGMDVIVQTMASENKTFSEMLVERDPEMIVQVGESCSGC
jgi:hypothetical protein